MAEYDPDEFFHHKRTNADRIRKMSDEELAEWKVNQTCPEGYVLPDGTDWKNKCVYNQDELDEPCLRCWLDWLKQEVDT